MNWCILIPLLVGLICAILGYLLGRLFGGNSEEEISDLNNKILKLEANLDTCKAKRAVLENALEVCKKSKSTLESAVASAKTNTASLTASSKKKVAPKATKSVATSAKKTVAPKARKSLATLAFDAGAAKLALGKKVKQDDLKIVEGIGPKIEGLFHNFDIKTWKALSEASQEKCQEVLSSGGDRYKIHKPGTWPKQAKFAYEGKWAELVKWQDELNGGKA